MAEFTGIDVSSWQGQIQWDKVKKDKIDFAILRLGYGTRIDKTFHQNMEGTKLAKIPCGVYLYSMADTVQKARDEAKFTIQTLKPYKLDFPVAFDIEDKVQVPLSNTTRTDIIDAYCSAIVEAGYKPMLYSSLSWFQYMFQLSRLENYDFWIAQWDTKQCTFSGETHIWQYSSTGKVNGIVGDVDKNIAYKEYTAKAPAPPTTGQKPISPKVGQQIYLSNAPLYEASISTEKSKVISGNYWVYDGKILNEKIRITNSKESVGKKPIVNYVTGYINLSDIKQVK